MLKGWWMPFVYKKLAYVTNMTWRTWNLSTHILMFWNICSCGCIRTFVNLHKLPSLILKMPDMISVQFASQAKFYFQCHIVGNVSRVCYISIWEDFYHAFYKNQAIFLPVENKPMPIFEKQNFDRKSERHVERSVKLDTQWIACPALVRQFITDSVTVPSDTRSFDA